MIRLGKGEYVYDIEADGLLDTITKIHCLSVCWIDQNGELRVLSTTDYDVMRKFFLRKNTIRIGHNISLYDERAIHKILGIETQLHNDRIIDTLPLSWYLHPEKTKHGLEQWGYELGIHKVEINDWQNLSSEEYIHRCEEDTKINIKMWQGFKKKLYGIYGSWEEVDRFIDYIQFKMDCVREQEETKIELDVEHVRRTLDALVQEKSKKEQILREAMPKVKVKIKKKYKNIIILSSGEFFQKGDMMYDHYFREGYKPKMEHEAEIIKGYKDPNPNSNDQKKEWLYSLGWVPEHFKFEKEDNGSMRKIPQISSKAKDGSVCDSIKKLFVKEPRLEVLEGLSVLSHRIGLLEGFLENHKEGFMEPSMAGLTNTLRLKHSKIVNLPGVSKKYGKEIRSSLIASEGEILCGSDMSSLEDTTKQHYMYPYDPTYVKEMRTPGFDPHLDIGVMSNIITLEESEYYKWVESEKKKDDKFYNYDKKKYEEIKTKRHKAKTTNFSSIYGVGAEKLAREIGISPKEAKKLLDGYWKRNESVKKVADSCQVKTIGNQKWLYNPVSRFWYSLRAEKDRFSTLNQGTGVYCFDRYIKYVREKGIKISLQMHDEILFRISKDSSRRVDVANHLQDSIKSVNDEIKLNVPLGISMDFGANYAECH
jgi:hypothetical protein